jgi:secretion/DNA translocation related TadE-like protein
MRRYGWDTSRRRRWRPANPERERGSATVVAVAMIALVVSIALGVIVVGSAVIARHRAQTSADLAALAAAGRLASGGAAACSWASSIAGAMHSVVAACRVEELDVIVAVDVAVNLGRWGLGSAHAAARAGPDEPSG